jgi:hypothetical protein
VYEFQQTLQMLVSVALGLVILLGAGFGLKRLFRKPTGQIGQDQLAALHERFSAMEAKLGDVEERLDFTERVLADVRSRLQLPGKP